MRDADGPTAAVDVLIDAPPSAAIMTLRVAVRADDAAGELDSLAQLLERIDVVNAEAARVGA